jgi:hypothetical protein
MKSSKKYNKEKIELLFTYIIYIISCSTYIDRWHFSTCYYFCYAIYWMFVETFQMVLVHLYLHVPFCRCMPWQTYHILASLHLCLICPPLKWIRSWLSCYMPLLFLGVGIEIRNRLIFHVVMLKKAFKDFGCKLFTIVMHDFLGLSINQP